MASVGAACGLGIKDLNFIYFDAHDDMDTPSTNENVYFESRYQGTRRRTTMGGSCTSGCAMWMRRRRRRLQKPERTSSGVIRTGLWTFRANCRSGSRRETCLYRSYIWIWTRWIRVSVKVNGSRSEGGLQDADVVKCMSLLPKKARPVSFTMCSFNPNLGDGDKIAGIGIRSAVAFVEALIATSVLSTQQ
jgi:arginase